MDRAAVAWVLDAIQPVGIEAALNMAENTRAEDDAKKAALELALERARYEANRVRRQFDAVDPETGSSRANWKHDGIAPLHKWVTSIVAWLRLKAVRM